MLPNPLRILVPFLFLLAIDSHGSESPIPASQLDFNFGTAGKSNVEGYSGGVGFGLSYDRRIAWGVGIGFLLEYNKVSVSNARHTTACDDRECTSLEENGIGMGSGAYLSWMVPLGKATDTSKSILFGVDAGAIVLAVGGAFGDEQNLCAGCDDKIKVKVSPFFQPRLHIPISTVSDLHLATRLRIAPGALLGPLGIQLGFGF